MGKQNNRHAARKKALLALVALLAFLPYARGQYYSTGAESDLLKWRQIGHDEVRIIYPQEADSMAARVLKYMDAVRPYVGYGYSHGPMRTPVVLHSRNFASNGISMWAPKRLEFVTSPSTDSYSMPWLKQLAVHEYRHNVQYNNLNRGWVRAAGYVLGQQAPLAALILLPMWQIEGDAVLAETQLSTYGRGLQPTFTIDYRMYHNTGAFGRWPMDKWFSGSYKDHVPDHYNLGYQMVSWTDNAYGHNIWDRVTRFTARNPYMIVPKNVALKKYYRTSIRQMFDSTFADLGSYWDSIGTPPNSPTIVETPLNKSYTTYSGPVALDSYRAVSIKNDPDEGYRIVISDRRDGSEQLVARIGSPSSRLSYADGNLWWTEYRQSAVWAQKINSQLCRMKISKGRTSTVRGERQALYPVAMAGGKAAFVKYNYDGTFTLKHDERALTLPDSISVHGLTYDDRNELFYFIGLSDSGMWIGSSNMDSFRIVTPPRHITISDLSSHGGRLFFTSIASGRDEAHVLDPATGHESRLTSSSYGSFAPATHDGQNIFVTTFTPKGYLLAVQDGGSAEPVELADVPANVVNPPRRKWDVFNIDSLNVNDVPTDVPTDVPKKFRGGLRSFNFHSWAPLYFEPDNIFSGSVPDLYAGVTLMSQNLLSSVVSTFQYGYTRDGSLGKASVSYLGLPVKFSATATYGAEKQEIVYVANTRYPHRGTHYIIEAAAYVPITLSSGRHIRTLTPLASLEYTNLIYPNRQNTAYHEGRMQTSFQLQYSDNVRMAYKDFLPKWGYTVSVGTQFTPTDDQFSSLRTIFVRGYLPGLAPHHSLRLRGYYLTMNDGRIRQSVKPFLRPQGMTHGIVCKEYYAAGADYQLPVWYPDGGIPSIIYFKRLRVNLGATTAEYKAFAGKTRSVYSYGGDLNIDFTPFRLPGNVTLTLTLSAYQSSWGTVYGSSLNIPF